jgi:4-hydroxybenzoate polyprenyltransferase
MAGLGLIRGLVAWARLARLPNLPTAAADILLGWWLMQPESGLSFGSSFPFALGASLALYTAGMIFNDVFDAEVDRRERPYRPIPSGAVSSLFAGLVAVLLMAGGLALAYQASQSAGRLATALAATILVYNAWAKSTPLGSGAMGLCRALNVLVGMAAGAPAEVDPEFLRERLVFPIANGLHILGVTVYAKKEAETSDRRGLSAGVGIIGLAWTLHAIGLVRLGAFHALGLGLGLAFIVTVGWALLAGVRDPGPAGVQRGVKFALLGLIVMNATLIMFVAGTVPGLITLGLLVPALVLGRFLYST